MDYPLQLEGFEGQSIVVRPAGFLFGPRLLVNGRPAPKGRRRGEVLLRRNDGRETVARWKSQLMGLDLPQLVVDGKVVPVAQPLKWYQWAWSALPVLLVLAGGALGALTGVIALAVNTRVFRSTNHAVVKFALTAVVSAAAVLLYLVTATLFVTTAAG